MQIKGLTREDIQVSALAAMYHGASPHRLIVERELIHKALSDVRREYQEAYILFTRKKSRVSLERFLSLSRELQRLKTHRNYIENALGVVSIVADVKDNDG